MTPWRDIHVAHCKGDINVALQNFFQIRHIHQLHFANLYW